MTGAWIVRWGFTACLAITPSCFGLNKPLPMAGHITRSSCRFVAVQQAACVWLLVGYLATTSRCDDSDLLLNTLQTAALIPASASLTGQEVGCWSFLPAYHEAPCVHLNTTALGVRIHVCKTNSHAGFAVMQSDLAAAVAQNVFRARAVGPTVELLSVIYCNKNLALAPYNFTHAGRYTIEILHLHSNYTLSDPSPLHMPELLYSGYVELDTSAQPGSLPAARSRVCSELDGPGTWLYSAPEVSLVKTCVHEDYRVGCLPWHLGTGRNQSGLTWSQDGCSLQHFTNQESRSCLAARKLCLFGDSHMRYLYNFLYDLVVDNRHTLPPGDRENAADEFVEFFQDPWGTAEHSTEQRCGVIVRNTGAWHVAYTRSQAGHGKPDLADYAARVRSVANSLQSAKTRGIEVIWMTTNGQPINLAAHTHTKHEHKDHRTDPMLLSINRLANSIMNASGIPVFDTWSMTSAVADMAYDGAHFLGDVGYFITHRLLSSICQP